MYIRKSRGQCNENTFCSCFSATYDIQDPNATSINDDSQIMVTGELIDNSEARGGFLVIECNISTEIIFIAIKRNEIDLTLSVAISMSPSNYTVYIHDLEGNALPNSHPAHLVPYYVEVLHGEGKCELLWVYLCLY